MTKEIVNRTQMNGAQLLLESPNAKDNHAAIIAVAFNQPSRTVNYSELRQWVASTANQLRWLEVLPQDRVLMILPDSIELVDYYLATMAIGAIAVAINYRQTAAELMAVITDAEPKLVIVHHDFVKLLDGYHGARIVLEDGFANSKTDRSIPQYETNASQFEIDYYQAAETDAAFWVYSSGTTGKPKAVIHCHGDLKISDNYLIDQLAATARDRIFVTSKLYFAYALGISLFGTLRLGATAILLRDWPDAHKINWVIGITKPSLFFSVPTVYRLILREGIIAKNNVLHDSFRQVRVFVSAGERLPEQLYNQWLEAGVVPICDGYGTSETVFMIVANGIEAGHLAGTCGLPVRGVEWQLRPSDKDDDDRDSNEIPGSPRILWLRHPSLFAGYWRLEEATRAVLDKEGWFNSGDLFSLSADGGFIHHGRADDRIKLNGQWLAPLEIENLVLQIKGVREAALVACQETQAAIRPTLFLVLEPSISLLEAQELITITLSQQLSPWKVPRYFQQLDSLPRTSSGKIKRTLLRQWNLYSDPK